MMLLFFYKNFLLKKLNFFEFFVKKNLLIKDMSWNGTLASTELIIVHLSNL